MEETIPILPVLLPIGAILLIWVIRHKDWLQARLLGENGLKDKLLPKSWPWHLAKSLSREWHQDKAVLITGCDSGLGYRCAALTSAKLISINFHFMQYKKSTFQDIKSFCIQCFQFLVASYPVYSCYSLAFLDQFPKVQTKSFTSCSLAVHCHSLGMVVIALCHTSSSNAGADALEQLNIDGRMFVVRNWDITSQGAAEVAQKEVSFFSYFTSLIPLAWFKKP